MEQKQKHWRYLPAISGAKACSLFSLSAAIAAIDQGIKHSISAHPPGTILLDASPVFDVVHTQNSGAAFSLFSGRSLLLLLATTLMLFAIAAILLFVKNLSASAHVSLSVLLGGGIGNWIDRMQTGLVTDYIRLQFIRFPVFNFADICITLSVLAMILLLLFDRFESDSGDTHGSAH